MNRICFFLLLLILCLLAMPIQASAIDSLKAFIQKAETVKATFTQILLDQNSRTIQESSGTMLFERPGKFRWIYEKPYEQLIVSDGATVWFYDQDLNQVTVRQLDLSIGSSPAALLAGNSAIESNFDLHEINPHDQTEWLEATPKTKDSSFELIQLGFSQEGTLQIMALRDNFGQTTLLTFSDLTKNIKLPSNTFKFIPPHDADIISD